MDLLSKQNITYIVIFIFILLSLTNLYNKSNDETGTGTDTNTDTENFMVIDEDQTLNSNVNVYIPRTNQVMFGTATPNKYESLQEKLDTAKNSSLSSLTLSGAGDVGTYVHLFNTDKTADNKAYRWSIYNGTEKGLGYDCLSFWRYDKNKGCNGGMCNRHLSLLDNGSSIFEGGVRVNGPLNIATDIVVTPWFSNTGNAPFVISAKTVPVDKGNLSITTTDWGSNNTYSTMNIIGRFHLVCSENFDIYIKGGMNIYKNADIPGSGNLSVGGTLQVAGKLTTHGFFSNYIQCNTDDTRGKSPGVGYFNGLSTGWLEAGSGEVTIGPTTTLISKANDSFRINTKANHMDISGDQALNIYTKGGLYVRKNAEGNGYLNVGGTLDVDGQATFNGNIILAGNPSEIRKSPASANPDLHLITNRNLFLMARDNVYIYKEPDSDYWNKPSGNLIVQGNLTVGPDLVLHSQGGSCYINTGPKYLDFYGDAGLVIYNKEGLYVNGNAGIGVISQFTRIHNESIQFGGANANNKDKDNASASITINRHSGRNCLDIVGYTTTGNHLNRKIVMHAQGGMWINGNLWISGSIFAEGGWIGSDIRLKENIKNVTQNEKDKLLQLVPKTYNLISDENKGKRYGLIAQEVEELFPELVNTDSTNGMKSMNYTDLIPLLIEQIKELKKTIPNQSTLNIDGIILTKTDIIKLKQLIK